jgi:hypothetical protein
MLATALSEVNMDMVGLLLMGIAPLGLWWRVPKGDETPNHELLY